MVCTNWRGFSGLGALSSGSRSRGCPSRSHPAWSSAAQPWGFRPRNFWATLKTARSPRASSRLARPQSGRQTTTNRRTYPIRLPIFSRLLRRRRSTTLQNDGICAEQVANVPGMLAPTCTTLWRQSWRAPRSCCTGGPAHCPHPDSGRVTQDAPSRSGRGCPPARRHSKVWSQT